MYNTDRLEKVLSFWKKKRKLTHEKKLHANDN